MKHLVIALCLSCMAGALPAQSGLVEKARELAQSGKTDKARLLLEEAWKSSKNEAAATALIAWYAEEGNTERGLALAMDLGLSDDPLPDRALLYGRLLMQAGRYRTCVVHGNDWLLRYGYQPGIDSLVRQCETLIASERNFPAFRVKPAGFNSRAQENGLTNYRRHLVFLSNREKRNGAIHYLLENAREEQEALPLLRSPDGADLNATLCYSPDGNEVFYTGPGGNNQTSIHWLYQASSMGNAWVGAHPLPFSKAGTDYRDPALHPNGQWLVFSSDAPGQGGADLFVAERQGETWKEPQNLGLLVNSPRDEISPYFDPEGYLYFASDRPGGWGGYDLYRSRLEGGTWLAAELLPAPLNTPFNETGYTQHPATRGGWVTSDRPGGAGGSDFWEFQPQSFTLGLSVVDAQTGQVVEGAEVQLFQEGMPEAQGLTDRGGLIEFAVKGTADYRFAVRAAGYLEASTPFSGPLPEARPYYSRLRLERDPEAGNRREKMVIAPAGPTATTIPVHLYVVNESGGPVTAQEVRLINLNANRAKIITTDEHGMISQQFYPGNRYRFVIEHEGMASEFDFSTEGLPAGQPVDVRFELPIP